MESCNFVICIDQLMHWCKLEFKVTFQSLNKWCVTQEKTAFSGISLSIYISALVRLNMRRLTSLGLCWPHMGNGPFLHCMLNESQLERMYLLTCAPNEDSNQPVHPRSLISLRCPHEETLHPWLFKMRSEDSNQDAQMLRLIWSFTGRTCP